MSTICITLVYALPEKAFLRTYSLPKGSTVNDAILQSQLLKTYPDIDLQKNKVGIFGRTVNLQTELQEGDRLEIYRPLLADPREIRRQRALLKGTK